MGYLSIYHTLMPPPPEPLCVIRGADFMAILNPGPLAIRYQTLAHDPFAVGQFDFDYQTQRFPRYVETFAERIGLLR